LNDIEVVSNITVELKIPVAYFLPSFFISSNNVFIDDKLVLTNVSIVI